MDNLPTTSIGLIALTIIAAGGLVWRILQQTAKTNTEHLKTNAEQQKMFMTYIETKNHNLERATDNFIESSEKIQSERDKSAEKVAIELSRLSGILTNLEKSNKHAL